MDVFITGLNSYLAKYFADYLDGEIGYQVTGVVRKKKLFEMRNSNPRNFSLLEVDLVRDSLPLVQSAHSIAFYFSEFPIYDSEMYRNLELVSLKRYVELLKSANCKHLVYVTKLNDEHTHLIENCLREVNVPYTIVRVSNIVGRGSVLMNIMAKLSSFKNVLLTNTFAKSRCQPIGVQDVCVYLNCVMLDASTFGGQFDIVGQQVMTYKEVIDRYLKLVDLNRKIWVLPFSNKLITRIITQYFYKFELGVAKTWSASTDHDLIATNPTLASIYPVEMKSFDEAVNLALGKLESGHRLQQMG